MWVGAGQRRNVDDITAARFFICGIPSWHNRKHQRGLSPESRENPRCCLLDGLKHPDPGIIYQNIDTAEFYCR